MHCLKKQQSNPKAVGVQPELNSVSSLYKYNKNMYFCPMLLPNKVACTAGPWVFENGAFGFSTIPALTLGTSQSHGLGVTALPQKGNKEQQAALQDSSPAGLLHSKLAPD